MVLKSCLQFENTSFDDFDEYAYFVYQRTGLPLFRNYHINETPLFFEQKINLVIYILKTGMVPNCFPSIVQFFVCSTIQFYGDRTPVR